LPDRSAICFGFLSLANFTPFKKLLRYLERDSAIWKTGIQPSGQARGHAFPDHARGDGG
jgi:hypothetical protein